MSFVVVALLTACFGDAAIAQWAPLGLPSGASFRYVTRSSDTTWYGIASDRVFRKGADDSWRDVSPHTIYRPRALTAWNDTVAIYAGQGLTHDILFSFDGGATWTKKSFKTRSITVIPHTTHYVAWGERVTEGRILDLVNFVTDEIQHSDPIGPQGGGYLLATQDYVFTLARDLDDSTDLHELYRLRITSANIKDWIFERDTSMIIPKVLQTGGIMVYDTLQGVVYNGDDVDTVVFPVPQRKGVSNYNVIHDNDSWFIVNNVNNIMTCYLSGNGRDWQALPAAFRLPGIAMDVRSDGVTSTHGRLGAVEVHYSDGSTQPINKGLGRLGSITTDGRHVATLSHAGKLYVWDDADPAGTLLTLDGPFEHFDDDFNMTQVTFQGDYLWVLGDSLVRIDLSTNELVTTPAQGWGFFGTTVTSRNDTLFTTGSNRVYHHDMAGVDWGVQFETPRKYVDFQGLAAQDEGFLGLVFAHDTTRAYWMYWNAAHYTNDGIMYSSPIRVDSMYGDVVGYHYRLIPCGQGAVAAQRYSGNLLAVQITTNSGETWFKPKGNQPVADFNGLYDTERRSGQYYLRYSSDHGESWSPVVESPLPDIQLYERFCLDHHCYVMTMTGIHMARRISTSVDERRKDGSAMAVRGSTVMINGVGQLSIYRVTGERVMHIPSVGTSVDLSALITGTYLLVLQSQGNVEVLKYSHIQ